MKKIIKIILFVSVIIIILFGEIIVWEIWLKKEFCRLAERAKPYDVPVPLGGGEIPYATAKIICRLQ